MLKLAAFLCLAVAVLGQQQFERRRLGQGQQFGQSRFGRPQLRSQFGQLPQQQQFGQLPQQQQFGQLPQQQFGQQFQPRQQLAQPLTQQLDQPAQQLDQPLRLQLDQPLRQQQQRSDPVPILRQSNNQSPEGSFQYDYASADSIEVEAQGEQRQIGDGVGTVMQGSYSYVAPNGELIEVRWIADENGFQPIVSRSPSQ
ncbi:uncharacterized protein DDB_G0285291-like [Amphibalanus amphitrite]|uniref:uncharacterized protein DDB_G0285291-like n=1 Tax=Amphibalanus amphitrite TaxID=1232801 RepID=UPI001C9226F4|nr:uncharacterized protein DDB_G0285291-like [Amphibalanus amphitrite]